MCVRACAKKEGMGVDQDKDQWQALVDIVMNLQVPQNLGISQVTKQLLAFAEGAP
jgi:hypothetical protein